MNHYQKYLAILIHQWNPSSSTIHVSVFEKYEIHLDVQFWVNHGWISCKGLIVSPRGRVGGLPISKKYK